ncbi:proline--tRNA ligase [Candidatus Gracilibacteria bacterium CG17_big_fil_post_rev_8_21_14_2_50_48_13]|nr:MAG: proline--tRNA ligase [Candidatus Gracilibacteria bacterium CG17_big_fil_post_rev_8_21_14_2_50_48_13]
MSKQGLPTQHDDFSQWYTDVVRHAQMADYSPVAGCMVIKPYGYALWENMQRQLDTMIKAAGVQNAYFPLFIPQSYILKEAQHVEGFAPELATVTHVGEEKLEDPLVVRPTSETIMYATFKDWIQSYRDLPLKINQWANVVRMEKRTRLFLRTTEFLWQEGHTCHATREEAETEVLRAIRMYEDFARDYMAIPGYVGKKSPSETFAGAEYTLTIECLSRDMKAIQAGTSHHLGQNFAKAFDVQFQSTENTQEFVWQTSWGVSTRLVGALIVIHGDDKGLQMPPRIAPIQVIIVPIARTEEDKALVDAKVSELQTQLEGLRVHVDTRDGMSPGAKFYEWELKGVPLKIEVGPRDIANGVVVLGRRDTGEKEQVSFADVGSKVRSTLDAVHEAMYARALAWRDEYTHTVDTYEEFKKLLEEKGGFFALHWCGDAACEASIKEETKATTRCRPLNFPQEKGTCVYCGKESEGRILFAKAY